MDRIAVTIIEKHIRSRTNSDQFHLPADTAGGVVHLNRLPCGLGLDQEIPGRRNQGKDL